MFFGGAFEYGGGSKFWGYVGINPELLWVEFCKFVQCRTFVNKLNITFDTTVLNSYHNGIVQKPQVHFMFDQMLFE
jgi:hypothetical protein